MVDVHDAPAGTAPASAVADPRQPAAGPRPPDAATADPAGNIPMAAARATTAARRDLSMGSPRARGHARADARDRTPSSVHLSRRFSRRWTGRFRAYSICG